MDVLIVDDQRPFRSVARTVVNLVGGWRVAAEAETGEDAVAAAERVRPGVVLMDINLPGISGIEATRRIIASHPETRVVLLSTYSAADLPRRRHHLRGTTYLNKEDLTPRHPARAAVTGSALRPPVRRRGRRSEHRPPERRWPRRAVIQPRRVANVEIPVCAEWRVATAQRGTPPRRPSG